MSKETGILFSTPMVRAILERHKTQTRRMMKRNLPFLNAASEWEWYPGGEKAGYHAYIGKVPSMDVPQGWARAFCPYGGPGLDYSGDLLYVKEAHWRYGKWVKNGKTKTGRQRWRFKPVGMSVRFESQPAIPREQEGYHKRPCTFMPKWAARLWLEITGVRIERVQTIAARVKNPWVWVMEFKRTEEESQVHRKATENELINLMGKHFRGDSPTDHPDGV